MGRSESVLLLGFYHPRYVDPLRTWADRLRAVGCSVTEGYPDTWYPEDVLDALTTPRDLVVYFGHGEPGAWSGLGRIDAAAVASVEGEPHRLVLSACCSTFEGKRAGSEGSQENSDGAAEGGDGERAQSVGAAFLEGGLAEAVVGYDDRIRHDDNRDVLDHLLAGYRTAVRDGDDGASAVLDRARRDPALRVAGQRER